MNIKARNERIKKLYIEGKTMSELSKKYGISKQRISQILYEMGLQPKVEKPTYQSSIDKVNEKQEKEIEELKARVKELRERNHELSEKSASWCRRYYQLTSELNRQRETNNKQRAEIKELKEGITTESRVQELEHDVINLRRQIYYYKAEIQKVKEGDDARQLIKELREKITKLRNKVCYYKSKSKEN